MDKIVIATLEACGLSISSYLFYHYLKKQQGVYNLLEYMEKASILTPELLKNSMSHSDLLKLFKGDLINLKNYKNYSIGTGFVQGVISSLDPILSSINGETQMVISNITSESIFSNHRRKNEAEGIIESRFSNTLFLRGESAPSFIPIGNKGNIDYLGALSYVDSATHVRDLTYLEQFLSWIVFLVKLFLSMSNLGKRMIGFRVGTKRIERGVLLGQMIVVFGDYLYDKINKKVTVENPKYFLRDKYQLIAMTKNKSMLL